MSKQLPVRFVQRSTKAVTEHDSTYAWMLTFSDLLLLLLTLFVLRLSMSTLDASKLKDSFSEFPTSLSGPFLGFDLELGGAPSGIDLINPQMSKETQQLVSGIADGLGKKLGLPQPEAESGGSSIFPGGVKLQSIRGGARVLLPSSSFPAGTTEFSFSAAETVQTIAKSVAGQNVKIHIASHTDDSTPTAHPSNWELSSSRAMAVVRQMIDAGVAPQSISAAGYADSKPLKKEQSPEARHQNRRTEITITAGAQSK